MNTDELNIKTPWRVDVIGVEYVRMNLSGNDRKNLMKRCIVWGWNKLFKIGKR